MERSIESESGSTPQAVSGAFAVSSTAYVALGALVKGQDLESGDDRIDEAARPKFTTSNEEYERTGRQYLDSRDSCLSFVRMMLLIAGIACLCYLLILLIAVW
jgi:hypothetical protein